MTEAMRIMGFYDLANKCPNAKTINVSQLSSTTAELKANDTPYPIDLPSLFFDEIDFSITCPIPEVHCMTKVTLAFKNQ